LEREGLEERCDDGYLMSLSSDMSWHYNVLRGAIMSCLSKHPSQKFRTASHFDKNIYEWQRRKPTRCNNNSLLINPNQLDMFQATILPISRSIRLCNAACGMKHPRSSSVTRPLAGNSSGASYHQRHYTV
jgi:hypothetical protein